MEVDGETWLLEKDMKGEHGRKVGSHLVKLSCAPLNAPSAVPDGTPSPKIPTYTHGDGDGIENSPRFTLSLAGGGLGPSLMS